MSQFPVDNNFGKAQSATVALFVSDIHLDSSRPATSTAFLQFLRQTAMQTRQLYLLGDIFEYWAGDDDSDAEEFAAFIDALQQLHAAKVEVFWLAGNRDFLVGQAFAQCCAMQILAEPYLLHHAGQNIVLMHGDALCTDDAAYMAFRAQVRQSEWQQMFLRKPLAERKGIIAAMRKSSQMAQQQVSEAILDVNLDAVAQVLATQQCHILLHGHTHRPACHEWQSGDHKQTFQRHVLPDWECENSAKLRGGWISLSEDGQLHHHQVAELALYTAQ